MEQKDNLIQNMSYEFALKSIQVYKKLVDEKKEFVLSKQFLRAWTSIWANIEESLWWQSRKDFVAKLSISQKEAKESYYWIRLLHDSGYIDEADFQQLEADILSIIRVLSKILITTKTSPEV